MFGVQDTIWDASEHRTNQLTAEDTNRSQPLCFVFIDPMPKDMGDVAEWYRTQVTMLDEGYKTANKPGSLAKTIMHEFSADEPSDSIGEIQASLDQ